MSISMVGKRLERLERAADGMTPVCVVLVPVGVTEEEAKRAYVADHPGKEWILGEEDGPVHKGMVILVRLVASPDEVME